MAHARPGSNIAASAFDDDTSEHILLEGDGEPQGAGPVTERERIVLADPLRGVETTLIFYREGYLKVAASKRGKRRKSHRLDLRYVDPVPTIERDIPARIGYAALACAGLAAAAAAVARLDAAAAIAVPVALALAAAAVTGVAAFFYLIEERTVFATLHGRAPVLTLVASLGAIRRHRSALPALSRAIEDAGEDIGDDTKRYLRHEMREHYRLRTEGVLTDDVCSDSTGRILAQFDVVL